MPQLPVDKTYFTFVGGLNTEVSPLAFPEGSSLDEQNFEMLINGTRRRRKGLRRESGHTAGSVEAEATTYSSDMVCRAHRWNGVAGDPDIVFNVLQVGASLLFFTEDTDITPGLHVKQIDLTDMSTTDTEADVSSRPVMMAHGRGYLFVTGRYVDPFYVSYDPVTDNFTANRIQIFVRDFKGIDDGTDLRTQPATLSDAHKYNLVNRGWTDALITDYKVNSVGLKYPALNQLISRAVRRATVAGYAELDGKPEFNAQRLEAEAFGDSSAYVGALVLNPFNTGYAKLASAASLIDISTFSVADATTTTWLVTLDTASAHGLIASDTFTITNNKFLYVTDSGTLATGSLDGTFNVDTAPDADTITFYITKPKRYASWSTQYVAKGQVGADIVIRTDSYSTTERFQAIAFHAGRVWWAGAAHKEINDTIYFTQIVEGPKQFGKCYQEADPTAMYISSLQPNDGGTIIVPGMGQVMAMLPMEDVLVVFAVNGVWAIAPTAQGGFMADGYIVRQISNVKTISQLGVYKGDSATTFVSDGGIYVLASDPNSGQVNAQSISETTIQSLWNSIPDDRKGEVQVCYDTSKKRVYYLYGDETVTAPWTYNRAIVWDTRVDAFYKLTFPHSNDNTTFKLRGLFSTGRGDATDSAKKMKFVVTKSNSGTFFDVLDFDQTVFTDWDGTEQDAYIVTGYDNLGDFARHRQAPIIHVYMQKTETGYEEAVDGALTPVGESSCWLQARWDWADSSSSGKWGAEQQVYRHVRLYQPTGASDTFDSGYPVIVTRNKLRGRGRCLHLRFRADEGKDCHVLGWAIEYKGENKQ